MQSTVVEKEKPVLLKTFVGMYETSIKDAYFEKYGTVYDYQCYASFVIPKMKKADPTVDIVDFNNTKIVVPEANWPIDYNTVNQLQNFTFLQETALQIRDALLKVEKHSLGDALDAQKLIAGEGQVPEEVTSFLRTILYGVTSQSFESLECERKVDSLGQDLLYAMWHGKLKTSKHITLGLSMKSLTSSRKVVEILNKLGHTCSYTTIEELETAATHYSCRKKSLCPDGVKKKIIHIFSIG